MNKDNSITVEDDEGIPVDIHKTEKLRRSNNDQLHAGGKFDHLTSFWDCMG